MGPLKHFSKGLESLYHMTRKLMKKCQTLISYGTYDIMWKIEVILIVLISGMYLEALSHG